MPMWMKVKRRKSHRISYKTKNLKMLTLTTMTQTPVLAVKVQLIYNLPVHMMGAVRHSRVRFDFKHTCTATMGPSRLSVLFTTVIKPSVRSRTWRFTWGYTKTSDHLRVRKAVERVSGQKATCGTTSDVILERSKYWAPLWDFSDTPKFHRTILFYFLPFGSNLIRFDI